MSEVGSRRDLDPKGKPGDAESGYGQLESARHGY
jgi:hypothetical protein